MHPAIVIPNGLSSVASAKAEVRDLTQTQRSRNKPTAVIASIARFLAVCTDWDNIVFFYRALVPLEFKFL
jgi:hypothetical protein